MLRDLWIGWVEAFTSHGFPQHTPAGLALIGIMGVFADFERSMIQERVKAGIKPDKAQGQRWGRRTVEENGSSRMHRDSGTSSERPWDGGDQQTGRVEI